MKKYALILSVACLFMLTPESMAQEHIPYIYYYSSQYSSIIVERADGSDSHSFDIGDHVPIFGPGFSPDGDWFASSISQNSQGRSTIVSVNHSASVSALNPLPNVSYMEWSPNSQYILVSGSFDDCDPFCRYRTYWLIDVGANGIVATAHDFPFLGSPRDISVRWSQDNHEVYYYAVEESFGNLATTGVYQITMNTDGDVTKQEVSYEEYDVANPLSDEISPFLSQIEFVSPDGRYSISAYSELTDIVSGDAIRFPVPDFDPDPNSSYAGNIVEAKWDASGDWVILGYSIDTGNAWGSGIMRSDGSDYRQLSDCGFSPSCIGWLPENVDVDSIPLAAIETPSQ
ncbi:MAG: hypothetical protein KME04_17100 [Pleurocapsa minor GSE-CHR-MK-17-07R]|jgi:hypothetical protein|nr:hypothetical protein [Pleurocapsa minor GSE-CHR-MK 17-07R]